MAKKIPGTLINFGIALIVFFVIILGFFLALMYQGSTEPIKKVADQFQAPAEWKQISERVTPPKIACIGDNACPSLDRRWNTQTVLTKEQFKEILKDSGWNFAIERDCTLPEEIDRSGNSICSAEGIVDKFLIRIYVDDNAIVSLFIRDI